MPQPPTDTTSPTTQASNLFDAFFPRLNIDDTVRMAGRNPFPTGYGIVTAFKLVLRTPDIEPVVEVQWMDGDGTPVKVTEHHPAHIKPLVYNP